MSDTTVASTVTVTIDGHQVTVPPGTTLYDAALNAGITIPVLCHSPKLQPVAVCRMCVVEVQGARVLQASCIRQAEDGMVVQTQSDSVKRSRAMLTELLMADYPQTAPEPNGHAQHVTGKANLLLDLAAQQGITAARFPTRPVEAGQDMSSAVIQVNHDACIMCDRCIRACDDVQCNDVIGRAGKGYTARIAFDNDLPMGQSTCVSCGECMAACPTGALIDKPLTLTVLPETPVKKVDSLCPYCGVGCSLTYTIDMDWLLPGVRPTGRKAEFMVAVFIQFDGGKIAHEHAYWDQATVLSQLGVLDHPLAVGGMRGAAIGDDVLTFVKNLNRSS